MDVLSAAVSGIIGTIAMIAVIYVFPFVLRTRPLNIPLFVGSLLSSRPRVAGLLGTGVLLFNGSVIAGLGRLVWRFGTGAQGLLEGLEFGTLLGLLSMVIMRIMFAVHPQVTEVRPVSQSLVALTLWVGHLAYGALRTMVAIPRRVALSRRQAPVRERVRAIPPPCRESGAVEPSVAGPS